MSPPEEPSVGTVLALAFPNGLSAEGFATGKALSILEGATDERRSHRLQAPVASLFGGIEQVDLLMQGMAAAFSVTVTFRWFETPVVVFAPCPVGGPRQP
jgi:hypothetical protein